MNMVTFYLGKTLSEKDINGQDIYQSTGTIKIMERQEIILVIEKGEFFRLDDAPDNIKEQLKFFISQYLAKKYVAPIIEVKPTPVDEIEELEQKIDEVINIDAQELVNKVLDETVNPDEPLVIPDMIDGKISKGSGVVKQAIETVEEMKTQKTESAKKDLKATLKEIRARKRKPKSSKLERFRRKHGKST